MGFIIRYFKFALKKVWRGFTAMFSMMDSSDLNDSTANRVFGGLLGLLMLALPFAPIYFLIQWISG